MKLRNNFINYISDNDIVKWYNYIFPEVEKHWLFILSGVMWLGVGVLLNSFAVSWLTQYEILTIAIVSALGLIAAYIVYRFGFMGLALKNIKRIHALEERNNILQFQQKSSYIIVPVMIAMGIILRHSFIPKNLLAILYIGIGGGLFFASFHYFHTIQVLTNEVVVEAVAD